MRLAIAFVLIATSTGIVSSRAGQASVTGQTQPQVVRIQAERFQFTPSEVRTVAGTTLQFELTSEDTDHGFAIKGSDINVSIPKRGRGTRTVTFTPPGPGRYTFECSHVCGAGHSFMRGVIVVAEPRGDAE